MTCTLRFAPSPTGRLHVGNIRTALANWLYARKHQGTFILRLDDTDEERSTQEFAQGILNDLQWLGIDYDICHRQSDRHQRYDLAVNQLKEIGRLYPCYETAEELAFKRKQQLGRGHPPLYDRASLNLSSEQKRQYETEGRRPHWRFKLTPDTVAWNDLVHGSLEFSGKNLSDPVLLREDGTPIYTLSSVVDDIELGITHVFRGDDHIANTALQIQLIEALGASSQDFTFAHMPLLTDGTGKGLSKRFASLSIDHLRSEGLEPMAINSFLGTLGTSGPVQAFPTIDQLIETFDITHVTKSPPKFSLEEMYTLNCKLLHHCSFDHVSEKLEALNIKIDQDFWEMVQGNLNRLQDVAQWWSVCYDQITPLTNDPDYVSQALSFLPMEPWDTDTWSIWTQQVKEATHRKGKKLFMPLREALTGQSHGPEMKYMLPRIGYEKARKRLQGHQA